MFSELACDLVNGKSLPSWWTTVIENRITLVITDMGYRETIRLFPQASGGNPPHAGHSRSWLSGISPRGSFPRLVVENLSWLPCEEIPATNLQG